MVLEYASVAEVTGEHEPVVGHLRAVAQQDQLDERIHARLMIALLALGQQAAGLRVYEDLRRRLDEELGVRPGPELAGAHLRVLRQELGPAARERAASPGIPGIPAAPGAGDAPQFAELPVPRQLPPAGPYFVGRTAELSAPDSMLSHAGQGRRTALIAAVGGSAGAGKTALSPAKDQRSRWPSQLRSVSVLVAVILIAGGAIIGIAGGQLMRRRNSRRSGRR